MNRLWRWLGMGVGTIGVIALLAYAYICGPRLAQTPLSETAGEQTSGDRDATATETRVLRLGWTAWADAEVVTTMAARLVEQRLGYRVERVMTDIGIQYQAVAAGDLDIMLMAWLPLTHRNYWDKVHGKVVNLGPIYMGRLGWVVPNYIPADSLHSIEDLNKPEVAQRINHRIQGIDPGSGLMQASEQAMRAYGLEELKLVSASGAAMTAVLDRAYRNGDWVVVTAWQPHWIFARYDLRFLEDRKQLLGGQERVHAIARKGFEQDFPAEVTGFFTRLYLPNEELAQILLDTQSISVEEAVERYIREHPRRIHYWLSGEMAE